MVVDFDPDFKSELSPVTLAIYAVNTRPAWFFPKATSFYASTEYPHEKEWKVQDEKKKAEIVS